LGTPRNNFEFVFYHLSLHHLETTIPAIANPSRPMKNDKLEANTIKCLRKSFRCTSDSVKETLEILKTQIVSGMMGKEKDREMMNLVSSI